MATRRHRTTTRIGAVLVACALALVAVASAAQVTVNAPDHHTDTKTPCTAGTLPTTATGALTGGNFTHVEILNIPKECNNLPVSLVVYDTGGVQLVVDTGGFNTGAAGTATIATGSYNATAVNGVALLINTWGVRTSWVAPSSIFTCVALDNNYNPQSPKVCSVTNYTITGPTGSPGSQRMDITFTVVGNSKHSRVTINFTAGVFPWTPAWAAQAQATPLVLQLQSVPPYTCPSFPSLLTSIPVEGISDQNFTATVAIGQSGATYPPTGFSKLCPP